MRNYDPFAPDFWSNPYPAYRALRDGLFRRIKQRFPVAGAPGV